MHGSDVATLAVGGVVAGIVNAVAGGGSLLTVPLLVLIGVPGTLANGTNRVAVLVQSCVSSWSYKAGGVSGFRDAGSMLTPLMIGSGIGAFVVSYLPDQLFEKLFGVVMLVMLVPSLHSLSGARRNGPRPEWPRWLRLLVFLGIGLYGGAFQAGVGLMLVMALAHAGYDLVRANSIKTVVVASFTTLAVAVFFVHGQIDWMPALVLSASTSIGAVLGVTVAVRGGERVIRPLLVASVLVLAGHMLHLY